MTTKHFLGYIRVSTDKQIESGAGLTAQINFINAEALRRGGTVEIISENESKSGKKLSNRPALMEALRRLDKGEAQGLIISKLDRLSRSVADFLTVLERSRKGKWSLVIGDLSIDTSTPIGEAMATVAATFAQLERARISERTKEGLAVKKAQGIKLGRPVVMSATTSNFILTLRNSGLSYSAIATQLNKTLVPPTRGLAWYASSVRATYQRVS